MTSKEFLEKLQLAVRSKTYYIYGCFGAPMTAVNKKRYSSNYEYNVKQAAQINALSSDTFGFDCVCLLKGILWGWDADTSKVYGGATYASNNVPDVSADSFANACADLTSNWNVQLDPGEILWMKGHVGVYIGNGLAIECTPAWTHNVLVSAVGNIGKVNGYPTRTWTKHGHSPYIQYDYVAPTIKCRPSIYIVQKGNKGEAVKSLQLLLNKHGAKLTVDGFFGDATLAALRAYQASAGLQNDGIAGVTTWGHLINT